MRRVFAIAAGFVVVALGGSNLVVWLGGRGPVTQDTQDVPRAQAALVLGAQVMPNGAPSSMLSDRITAAAELYEAGRVDKLLLSGDHGRVAYDEVNTMKRILLARDDTRQVARDWMQQHIPVGTKIVMEPIAPDQWATDAGHPLFGEPPLGTGSGARWNKYATSRSCFKTTVRPCPVVKLEDYERTLHPPLIQSYADGGFCWVVSGATQSGRAYADPEEVPDALDYYDALRKRGREVFHVSPYGERGRVPFSFDYSFNYYPLDYERPGPEITIYRIC